MADIWNDFVLVENRCEAGKERYRLEDPCKPFPFFVSKIDIQLSLSDCVKTCRKPSPQDGRHHSVNRSQTGRQADFGATNVAEQLQSGQDMVDGWEDIQEI